MNQSKTTQQLSNRLRGRLTTNNLGSREVERAARNLQCDRLQAHLIAGVSPNTTMTDVYNRESNEGQSPFAIQIGNKFESRITSIDVNKPNELRPISKLYLENNRFPGKQRLKVVDLKEVFPSSHNNKWLEQRIAATYNYIQAAANGAPCPDIILSPRLKLKLLHRENTVEPDALVLTNGQYRIVEIKSYQDRDGKTDSAKLRGACRQSAVTEYALRRVFTELDISAPTTPTIDLILKKPGSMQPTLRPMTIAGELTGIELFFNQLLSRLNAIGAEIHSIDNETELNQLKTEFRSDCREFCSHASLCREQAAQAGSTRLLGQSCVNELKAVTSIPRALELLHGLGQPPMNDSEKVLQQQLQNSLSNYHNARSSLGEPNRYAV